MIWRKLGLVWNSGGTETGGFTHGMAPTPVLLDHDVIRIYLTVLDSSGCGRARYVDVSAENPRQVLNVASHEVLGPGEPGCFDDSGVMPLSLVRHPDGRLFLYYAGFEICRKIRYRIFSGLAISIDGGETFQRYGGVPILDRSDEERFFRGGPFVVFDQGRFRMWYVAGSSWIDKHDKPMPVYDLRYIESIDGLNWPRNGQVALALTKQDEHGFGRPWIIKRGAANYQLFYSIRRESLSAYRLGYAESSNGIEWTRKDEELGLDVTLGSFDGNAIMYSAVISSQSGRTYCFYNGDDFGRSGFAVAELLT